MGEAAVIASSLDWVVFMPGLVIGRGAYGGTALLRMLAGSPMMTPLVHASARVQTVALDDVAAAVVAALKGEVPVRCDYDLAEEEPHTLREIVRSLRAQIGFAPARIEPDLPAWVAAPVSALADAAGWFGWRSPLRSTAMKVMGENVIADPAPWRAATGRALKSLDQTLAGLPGSAQERLFARAQLALPFVLVALAGFWIASGAIGLARINEAAALLPDIGRRTAERMVVAGGLVDIAIGVGLLLRPTSRAAAALSVVIAAVYLVMGGILAPHLWADPLGPYVKIIPAMTLGLALAIMLEER
ncbi:MAG: SDR family oxidoreductase, partial [Parvularculaceae bacterium]